MADAAPAWIEAHAHADRATGRPTTLLGVHLARVASAVAGVLAEAPEPLRRIAVTAALLHDAGKGTPWFQAYLVGVLARSSLTTHSRTGALLAWHWSVDWEPADRAALFQAVLRHHGSPDCAPWEEFDRLRLELSLESGLGVALTRRQLSALDRAGLQRWLHHLDGVHGLRLRLDAAEVDAVLTSLRASPLWVQRAGKTRRSLAGFVRDWTAYGALLALDRTDAATSGVAPGRRELPAECVDRYLAGRSSSPKGPLDSLRRRVSDSVLSALLAHPEHALFTLTAPTGAGKTLAVLRAALSLRRRLEETTKTSPRILYCLPFTSIIDQNHAVFRDVLAPEGGDPGSDVLLKHHHLGGFAYRTSAGREYEADGAGQLLVETWQSEVVVSTFHQLLHTFLSGASGDAVRAPAWVGSIVILDEVQAIPLRYWRPVGRLLAEAARMLGTRFILMTATRPLILAEEDTVELLSGHRGFFQELDRVDLELKYRDPWDLDQVVDEAEAALAQGSVLVVVNTRRAARDLARAVRDRLGPQRVSYLSTTLTPRDRRARIQDLAQRLGPARVVVSTQLIEAGVDLSFPTVMRDFAPIDCVIQTAGRCNRHAETSRGRVVLFQMKPLEGDRQPPCRQVYDPLLVECTEDALGTVARGRKSLREPEFLDLSAAYFEACQQRSTSEDVDRLAAEGRYRELASTFRLVEERAHRLWLVPLDAEAMELWRLYERARPGAAGDVLGDDVFRARREFERIRHRFMEHVVQESAHEEAEGVSLLPLERYDPFLGLLPHESAAETR